jgi:hypothetical protein
MDLSLRTEAFQQDDQSWLASEHGTSNARTVTLDISTFVAGTHYPNGFLPSGMPLGKITASGKYGLYDNAAVDGRQTLVGHLLVGQKVGATNTVPIVAPLFWHGGVIEAKLPAGGGVDSAGKTDVAGRITYF